MDRVSADFFAVIQEVKDKLKANPVAIQIPIGAEDKFTGLIDLISMKAYKWSGTNGDTVEEIDVPAELMDNAESSRSEMLDQITAFDDALSEKFIMEQPISPQELIASLRNLLFRERYFL